MGSCRPDKEPQSRTCSGRTTLLSPFPTTEVGLRQSKLSGVTCLAYHLPPRTHPWPNLGTLNHHIFHSFGQTTDKKKAAVCQKASGWERRPGGLNRELWLELRSRRGVCELWKKGQATLEEYKDALELRMEKIRRANAQLELSLTAAVKGNKRASTNVSATKGGLRRISTLLWMQGEHSDME